VAGNHSDSDSIRKMDVFENQKQIGDHSDSDSIRKMDVFENQKQIGDDVVRDSNQQWMPSVLGFENWQ